MNVVWNWLFNPVVRLKTEFPVKSIGQLAGNYVFTVLCFIVGSFAPVVLFFAFTGLFTAFGPEVLRAILPQETRIAVGKALEAFFANEDAITTGLLVSTFVGGFGAAYWSISRALRADGKSVRQVLALNLDSLNGSWKRAFSYSAAAMAIVFALELAISSLPLPKGNDNAAEMFSQLHGIYFLAAALTAMLGAPFFEEIVFRGFLYNSLRSILHKGKFSFTEPAAHMVAMLASSAVFAFAHHNNLISTMVLMVFAMIITELYRRSGSLYCAMLLHAMNNTVAMIGLMFGT